MTSDITLGHGFFLKIGKTFNQQMIDPFSLQKIDGVLVARRSAKRMLFMNQSPYSLVNLTVSHLRKFSDVEYGAIQASEFREQLQSNFSLPNSRCFDIRFGSSDSEKSMTVFAAYELCIVLLSFIGVLKRLRVCMI